MKNKLIKIIKNNKRLYNLAKKVNRKLGRISPKKEYKNTDKIYYAYPLNNINDMNKIKEHYSKIKTDNSEALIILENEELAKSIHKLIRENDDLLFCDENYFKNYNKKFKCEKILMLDYKTQPFSFLNYLR